MKQVISIEIDKLLAHPDNPNRMSNSSFGKLKRHIKHSGNYEPMIVRPHPRRKGFYQIVNGHHRTKALTELGCETADCIIWQIGDEETLVLLATLNRLSGSDDLDKRSSLIRSLCKNFDIDKLSKMLPDTKKDIERLKDLISNVNVSAPNDKVFLNPMVFFLTDDQKQLVEEVIKTVIEPSPKATGPQKRATALIRIANSYKEETNERMDQT